MPQQLQLPFERHEAEEAARADRVALTVVLDLFVWLPISIFGIGALFEWIVRFFL